MIFYCNLSTWLPKPLGSWKVWMQVPEAASQTFTVLSSLHETLRQYCFVAIQCVASNAMLLNA